MANADPLGGISQATREAVFERMQTAFESFNRFFKPQELKPPTLFHYTTVDGLHGIVTSHRLFASHISYLNDASEVAHAFDVAAAVNKDAEKSGAGEFHKGVTGERFASFAKFFFAYPEILRDEAYVTSFCESGDILGQWRGYGMGGFALAFDPILDEQRLTLWNPGVFKAIIRKVEYSDAAKREEFIRIVHSAISSTDDMIAAGRDEDQVRAVSTVCSIELQSWAHSVKDSHFKEEQEWRIVYFPQAGKQLLKKEGFVTRVRNGQFVPTIELSSRSGKLPIVGAVCGPNSSKDLTEKALRLLLTSEGYPDKVTSSAIPFRARY
jgi:hypothetical protein